MLNTQQAIAEKKKCLYLAAVGISTHKQQQKLEQPEQMAEKRATSKRRKASTVWIRQLCKSTV